MTNILVVLGSARKGRVADKILEYVKADVTHREGVEIIVADLKEIDLPFFDNENNPASPDYAPSNPKAIAWSEMVKNADSVLFITPEYNHTLSAIQKNALDYLSSEWVKKPVTAVAYGWSGGSLSVETLRQVLAQLKADAKFNIAQLAFMKDISPDGTLINEENVRTQIKTAIDEIV